MPLRIANIVGARPQFVKYAPIHRALAQKPDIQNVLIHSGQHYDESMSKIFFEQFGLPQPDFHLEVGSGTHAQQTGAILARVEAVLKSERIDVAIVYGDTNTTLGAALAASKLPIPVVHVEAGLRSFHRAMPEEINRVVTDRISSLLFAPSRTAMDHLKRENPASVLNDGRLVSCERKELARIAELAGDVRSTPRAINVGDLMFDALNLTLEGTNSGPDILEQLRLQEKGYYLLTLHRAENTDSPESLAAWIRSVLEIAGDAHVVFPVHPRTRKLIDQSRIELPSRVRTIDPVGYRESLHLLRSSIMLLTDSGGMQKEAYWLNVPCVTLREETEWVETIEDGWNVLYRDFLQQGLPKTRHVPHYGDGRTAERIVALLPMIFHS